MTDLPVEVLNLLGMLLLMLSLQVVGVLSHGSELPLINDSG